MENIKCSSANGIPRIRVLSIGNSGVGKSCLIKRFCEKRFVAKYMPTIGIDYGSTTVDVDGRKISVHFFDTSGSPLFEEVRTEFYRDMQGIMLTYDVTDRTSFLALDAWMTELRQNLGPCEDWNAVVVVCGTRTDTGGTGGRQVSEGDGRGWADGHNLTHVLTSAALGTGVTQAFHTLFVQSLQHKEGFRTKGSFTNAVDADVVQSIHRLIHAKDDFDKMSINRRALSKEEVNKSYRRLAALVHPDKCKAPGAEEAFKALTQARSNLLQMMTETSV